MKQGAFFMEKNPSKRRWNTVFAAVLLLLSVIVTGCSGAKEGEAKVKDLEFTVVGQNEIPQELMDIIGQKKTESFRLTYSSGEDLYIAAGYGEQKTGGYSIAVPELYLTENSITIKTELQGPEKGEQAGAAPSYPYIVVKTAFMEEPVVFK